MTWPWPWHRRRDEGLDEATVAVQDAARGLGRVEERDAHIDALAMRAEHVGEELRREREVNHFNARIRRALADGRRRP